VAGAISLDPRSYLSFARSIGGWSSLNLSSFGPFAGMEIIGICGGRVCAQPLARPSILWLKRSPEVLGEAPAAHIQCSSNAAGVIETIGENDPDYVILMEVDRNWQGALTPLFFDYPYSRFQTREDNFGIAFLSKKPWSSIEVLNSEALGLPALEIKFDEVELASGYQGALKILGVHPIPPMNHDHWQARNTYLETVFRRVSSEEATIVSGLAPVSRLD